MNQQIPPRIRVLLQTPIWIVAMMMTAATLFTAHNALAQPIGYSVRSDADDHLYQIDLSTGVATDIGPRN